MAVGTGNDWSNVDFRTMRKCSNALFGEFSKRFSALNLSSLSEQPRQDGASLGVPTSMQELLLLLRYCIGIVKFLVDDQRPAIKGTESLLLEKSKYLLQVLRDLCSSDKLIQKGEDAVSFECSVSATSCFVRPANQCIPFLCRMLEVFVDELLAHGALREYFVVLDSVSSTGKNLFTSWATTTNCMLELMSNHCLLSFSAVTDCGDFSEILSWAHKSEKILSAPQISLNVAVSLLADPVMISAPKLFHAHVISLCSEVIGFTNCCDMPRDVDKKLRLNCYLSTFERSVNLYIRLMTHFLDDDLSADDRSLISERKNLHLPFESLISPSTNDKINHIHSKFDKLWALQACTLPTKTKSDIVTSATAYVKENSHLIDEQCRSDAVSYLRCLIEKEFTIGSTDTTLIRNCEKDVQQVYLLSATLKLMHCSILQAFCSIKRIKEPSHFKTSTDSSLLEGYKFLHGLIQSFGQYKIGLEIEKLFASAIHTQLWRHKELKLMFVHFTGLLALSLARGLHILVNECMLVMIALINLLIFEEGSLDFLGHMLDSGVEHLAGNHASNCGSDVIGETLERTTKESKYRTSSLKVACKFQEIKMMHARVASVSGNGSAATKESQEICNGEIFLECVGDDRDNELAEFIECKEGRDYSIWLKVRQRYQRRRRKWLEKKRTMQKSMELRRLRNLFGSVGPKSCQKLAPVSR